MANYKKNLDVCEQIVNSNHIAMMDNILTYIKTGTLPNASHEEKMDYTSLCLYTAMVLLEIEEDDFLSYYNGFTKIEASKIRNNLAHGTFKINHDGENPYFYFEDTGKRLYFDKIFNGLFSEFSIEFSEQNAAKFLAAYSFLEMAFIFFKSPLPKEEFQTKGLIKENYHQYLQVILPLIKLVVGENEIISDIDDDKAYVAKDKESALNSLQYIIQQIRNKITKTPLDSVYSIDEKVNNDLSDDTITLYYYDDINANKNKNQSFMQARRSQFKRTLRTSELTPFINSIFDHYLHFKNYPIACITNEETIDYLATWAIKKGFLKTPPNAPIVISGAQIKLREANLPQVLSDCHQEDHLTTWGSWTSHDDLLKNMKNSVKNLEQKFNVK